MMRWPVSSSPGLQTPFSSGFVLWTLTKGDSTAEARAWDTPAGFEFELQVWTGLRIDGEEDLSWLQIFATEELLAETARVKKCQLEASGWTQDKAATPL